jgi:hypothetical protein
MATRFPILEWLRQGRALMVEAFGEQGESSITVADSRGVCLYYTFKRGSESLSMPVADVERKIVEVLGDEVLLAKVIARRCNRTFNSHFRNVLAKMTKLAIIQKVPGHGYRVKPLANKRRR